MMDKYEIIGQTLKDLNLDSELVSFKENSFDDEALKLVEQIDDLKELIPSLGFRIKFFHEIKRVLSNEKESQKFIKSQVKKSATFDDHENDKEQNVNGTLKSVKIINNGFAAKLSQIQMNKFLDTSVGKYTQEMEKWTDMKLFKESELIEAHFSIKNQTIEEILKRIEENFDEDFNSKCVENLKLHMDSKMNEKFSQEQIGHFEKLEKLQEKVDRTKDHFYRVYCQNMNKNLDKWYRQLINSPAGNFGVAHRECLSYAAFDFENYLANFVKQVPQKVLDDFNEEIEESMEGFKKEFENIRDSKNVCQIFICIISLIVLAMITSFLSKLYKNIDAQ